MLFVNGFIIFSLIITATLIYGLFMFMVDYEENKCEMTYMFQYPKFVRISMKEDDMYKRYGLYVYSEGRFTERARKMHFDGIPVLFIPGNAGSFQQARSLASVALRKALDSRSNYHFDYFTVDLNEELTGLHGAFLNEQMQYVNHSISHILKLYTKPNERKSIVLIGHSMGGLIAKGLVSNINPTSDLIPLIITLASPLRRLPIILDTYSYEFYENIRKSVVEQQKTTVISLSGGYGDFLVPSFLTSGGDLNSITTHIPKVWLPVDHLCILWCKQLILVLNRALFDAVDLQTRQISKDYNYRLLAFKNHLIHNSGTKPQLSRRYVQPTNIDASGEWIEYLPRQYTVDLRQGTKHIKWYMFRLVNQPNHESLTIVAQNLEVTDWIYACPASIIKGQSRVCENGIHLSHLSEVAPTARYKRRLLQINLHELSKNYTMFTHVVAKILPTSEHVTLHVDIHSASERKVIVTLPNRWSLKENVIIEETAEKAISYELQIPHLYHITQSYLLHLEYKKCTVQTHHASASLIAPWGHHNVHKHFTEIDQVPLDLRLHMSRPAMSNSTSYVKLTLDPNCRYRVSIKSSISNSFAQFVRFYSPLLIANFAAVVLLTFRSQLHNMGTKGSCSLFFTALKVGAKPFYVLPVVKISSLFLGIPKILKFLPVPDWQILHEEAVDFFFLPLILYFVGVGLVWVFAVLLSIAIMFFESTFHRIALNLLSISLTGTMTWSDWLLKGFHKLPGFVACFLIVLSFSTCGGLALCLGCIFYFLKLTQMSQDLIESIVLKIIKALVCKFRQKVKQNVPEVTKTEPQNEQSKETKINEETSGIKEVETQERDVTPNEEIENVAENIDECDDKTETIHTSNDVQEQDVEKEIKSKDESSHAASTSNINDTENVTISDILLEITKNDELYFHFTIFCMWTLVACLNIPSVLTWARDFKFNPKLEPDPSMMPGLILCICAFPLWQFSLPKVEKKWYIEMSYVVYFFTIIGLVYGILSVYRMTYVLIAVIVLITFHQLFAPMKSNQIDDQSNMDEISYNKVKAKLE